MLTFTRELHHRDLTGRKSELIGHQAFCKAGFHFYIPASYQRIAVYCALLSTITL
ncbi:MAG: hypothetical protein IH960_05495 [Chloroflexi bacterium]|nr:hypothetical protein [Chloroflexota bacterium]